MIKASELKKITNEHKTKEKVNGWIEIALPQLNKLLVTRAKLGKTYLHLGQGNIKWMSVPDFRLKLSELLVNSGYHVSQEFGNNIKITWN